MCSGLYRICRKDLRVLEKDKANWICFADVIVAAGTMLILHSLTAIRSICSTMQIQNLTLINSRPIKDALRQMQDY